VSDILSRLAPALADRYLLEREIGTGGMATVYLAGDVKHHRKVAVKVLRPELAATLGSERFFREIEVAARLQHPHILPLLDSGEADGFFYYVMPFIVGESLRERLARDRELPIAEAVKILTEVVDALAAAHAAGVVHRDIKPDNVMLSGRHALVMDFGVAKAVSEATGRHSLTTAGIALGTPAYMAPEQAAADPHLDHRVDLYAVGVLGYELLAGRPPFTGRSPQEVLAAHVTQAPEPVERHRPGVPPVLSQLLMRCLAKRPADRWQTADELLTQLESLATPSGGATPTGLTPVPRVALPLRRTRDAAILILLLALLGGSLLLLRRHAAESAPARATDSLPSVGVLPFTDLGHQPGQEYFADGLTDEVLVALSKLPGLRVPGHASSFYFKGSHSPLASIAESLHVKALLTATVQRDGNRVRVRAELVNAADGFQLWSESYDRGLQDLFAVYDDVAHSIAGALRVKLGAETVHPVPRRGSPNAEAYNAYLQGQYYLTNRQIDSALTYLERSVKADSTYALAWSALSLAHLLSPPAEYSVPGVHGAEAIRAGRDAAERALALDSRSAEAHTAAGFLAFETWRWGDAEREYRTAIQLDPSYARARHFHAIEMLINGDRQGALAEIRAAQALDPLSWIIGAWVVHTTWMTGDHVGARVQSELLVRLNPRVGRLAADAGLMAVRSGDFAAAAPYYGRLGLLRYGDSTLARRWEEGLGNPGRRRATADEIADSVFRRSVPGDIDLVSYAGDMPKALAMLKSLPIEPGEVGISNIVAYVSNPELRRTPEFKAILKKMGMTE
jgi:serine/threonine-protein kinase